ncbi:hypothetical protein JOF29_007919 [Kribbella aluminosa]|uniref:Uncharacterized protein n=1 Tax=Kribbella aluminosa TaxID=416017 RepID=A0ABS4UYU5_9ACTN|nr:hypothetical protein [Kribbella aluminosa]MBP2356809.1 hypothetical protein [Kribbella aluminosa]
MNGKSRANAAPASNGDVTRHQATRPRPQSGLQAALNEATARDLLHHAREAAADILRPGDFTGGRTAEEIAQHNRENLAALESFRERIEFLSASDEITGEIHVLLKEALR